MIKIAVADDHEIFREGLVKLIESNTEFEIVGQASDGDNLLTLLESNPADVAIVDVSMPGPGTPGICQSIAERGWKTHVIVLTMHQDASLAQQLLASGVRGFVLKRSAFHDLESALLAVASGSTFVSPLIAGEVVKSATGKSTRILSDRELEVVKLVADGHTNEKIGRILSISVKTVQTHRARAMGKLGVHSATELVRRLSQLGILSS